jgi:MFS family permease
MSEERLPRSAILFLAANVLFGSGLFFHAFLYNFYLDKLGLSPAVMGRAAAALTTGGLVTLLPAGWVFDRLGARASLLAGALITAIGLAAGAIASGPLTIYLAAAIAGAGNALWRVTQAPVLMKVSPSWIRSRLFAWNVGLIIASGAVGIAFAGGTPAWLEKTFAVDPLTALRIGLAIGAVGTASSLLLFAMLHVSVDPRPASAGDAPTIRVRKPVLNGDDIRALRVVALIGCWMLGPALVAQFFNLYFFKAFGLPVDRVGIVIGVSHVVIALVVVLSGELALRLGASRVLAGWLFFLGPVLLLLPAVGLYPAVLLYFLQGLSQPSANPLIDQMLMEGVAPERRGAISSWRNVAADASAIAGASLGGWILTVGSFPALFITAGLVGMVATLPLTAGLRNLQRSLADVPAS